MRSMLDAAGFTDINIKVKENAADIINDWMPGTGAEKYVTSAYVTAFKPKCSGGVRDDVRVGKAYAELAATAKLQGGKTDCGPGA